MASRSIYIQVQSNMIDRYGDSMIGAWKSGSLLTFESYILE
jgi:hypothetical protein